MSSTYRLYAAAGLAALFLAAAALTGCDTTVSEHSKSGRTWDGRYKTETTTVKERPDGSRYVEHESSSVRD